MSTMTSESAALRVAVATNRGAMNEFLERYNAVNPRLFGSVARGDATATSNVDVIVDLVPEDGNELLRVAGIAEELGNILGSTVEVVAEARLRSQVSASALREAVSV